MTSGPIFFPRVHVSPFYKGNVHLLGKWDIPASITTSKDILAIIFILMCSLLPCVRNTLCRGTFKFPMACFKSPSTLEIKGSLGISSFF